MQVHCENTIHKHACAKLLHKLHAQLTLTKGITGGASFSHSGKLKVKVFSRCTRMGRGEARDLQNIMMSTANIHSNKAGVVARSQALIPIQHICECKGLRLAQALTLTGGVKPSAYILSRIFCLLLACLTKLAYVPQLAMKSCRGTDNHIKHSYLSGFFVH